MERRTKMIAGGALALAAITGGTGIGLAGGGEDQPLAGSALRRAVEAALASTGGGTVVETEAGDDGAAYGVEIRLEDGTVVEVALDAGFNVIGRATDDDGPADQDGAGDD